MSRNLIARIVVLIIALVWLGAGIGGLILPKPENAWCTGFCMGGASACAIFAIARWSAAEKQK